MNDDLQITKTPGRNPTLAVPAETEMASGNNKPDAKALRVEYVARALEPAYAEASKVKLKAGEWKRLTAPFSDEDIEIRPYDGIVYISHMLLRQRLWSVLEGNVAEICRERFMRIDANEICVDLVLLVRGVMVAEAIGTAKYHPQNANMNYGDAVEAAWSDALRRCCKKWGIGTEVWVPSRIREWKEKYAAEHKGKWIRTSKTSFKKVSEPAPLPEMGASEKRVTALPETDEDGVPF